MADESQAATDAASPSSGEQASLRLSRTTTWGGIETASVYGPGEEPLDYDRDLGEPGSFPYTRGSFPQMYRSKMWTLRNIVGYGTPSDTRDGLERALADGSAGIDIVVDAPSQEAIDPDHPTASGEVGTEGCTVGCLADLEQLLDGIDVTKTDIAWHSTLLTYPLVVALARKQGLPLDQLQGSHMPDHVQHNLTGYGDRLMPVALGHRAAVDCLEYVARNSPKWSSGFPQGYALRERGLTPVGEIAVGMAIVNATLQDLHARGVSADDIAPSLAWVSTSGIDLFEEVAKFRALRRVWSRTLSQRFGATNPRSLRLRIACHTAGSSLTYQQPMNNVARATVQTLAAILGGVQAVETCTYDEPISIPTHEAREIAIRTQQILAHEVGAARTADPLGGSWYVESLTDDVEAAALELLGRIEEIGLVESVESGWLAGMMDDVNSTTESELACGDRILVGVNAYVRPASGPPTRFSFDRAPLADHLRQFAARKMSRDQTALEDALCELFRVTAAGQNAVEAMVQAFLASATIGEVWGTFRCGMGLAYDPFGVLDPPFAFS